MQIRLGLPKGSMQEATFDLFRRAGFNLHIGSRSYFPTVDDPELECILLRPQEIPGYVAAGALDAGLAGQDWILETEADVVEAADLAYAKQTSRPVRLVVAVAQDSEIQSVRDLQGKRIATEVVRLTKKYLAGHGVEADVEYSWGATEAKVPELVDAIVDLTETGSSLRAHGLRILDTVLESTTKLIANRASWADPAKRAKIESLAVLLQGALRAEGMVGLKLNCRADRLQAVTSALPAMKQPTISPLADPDWVALEVILDARAARDLIPRLKAAGAQDIVEYPLNKVVP